MPPLSVPPAIAPITATPSFIPTWRLVDAIAAATPACAPGIPETAVFVMISTSPSPSGSGLSITVPAGIPTLRSTAA